MTTIVILNLLLILGSVFLAVVVLWHAGSELYINKCHGNCNQGRNCTCEDDDGTPES